MSGTGRKLSSIPEFREFTTARMQICGRIKVPAFIALAACLFIVP